jgi:PAS domain S-box-containing protein
MSCFEELPVEAHVEKEYFRSQGIRSFINFPMFFGKSLIGSVGFISIRASRDWEVDIIALLRIVGEIFANAIGRSQMEESHEKSESRYRLKKSNTQGKLQKQIFIKEKLFDISTERKQIERQIQFLSYAVEHSTDGIALVDLNGRILSVNHTFALMHGYDSDELPGKHISIFHPCPLKEYLETSHSETEAKGELKVETWHARRDGTIFPANIYKSFLADEAGSPIGQVIIIKEITKKRDICQSGPESEDSACMILDGYGDPAVLIDIDGAILGLNDLAAKGFDKHSDELLGTCLYDFLPPKQATACKKRIDEVTESAEPVYFAKGFRIKSIDENYCPILDEHGKVAKIAILYKNAEQFGRNGYKIKEKEEKRNQLNSHVQYIHEYPHQRDLRDDTENKESLNDFFNVNYIHENGACRFCFENIISRSPKIWELFEILPSIAESVGTVLIQGESGTGKRLFANAIHNLSTRRNKPFITVNCGALPDTLLESELFGYKAGAFTDAKKDKLGRFALAEGGSLFLDEIGDISPAMQVRLLRFLQERIYEPLGSVKSIKGDVRIITATNKNLEVLVQEGKFRQDLFYRINVVRLDLPPLRERLEDVPLLVNHFMTRFNEQYGKKIDGISEDALMCLLSYDYPGNVRELENIIERAIILCQSEKILSKHLPGNINIAFNMDCPKESNLTQIHKMEAAFLMNILRQNNWCRIKTARQLGIHKTTLFRKIKTLGLKVPKSKRHSDFNPHSN